MSIPRVVREEQKIILMFDEETYSTGRPSRLTTENVSEAQDWSGFTKEERAKHLAARKLQFPNARFVRLDISYEILELRGGV
jgi:hypothetical protein